VSHASQAWLVAEWEFRRYFKWKDQVLGLLFFMVLSGLGYGASRLVAGQRRPMAVLALGVELAAPVDGRVQVHRAPADTSTHRALLREGDADGILTRRSDGTFDLLVEKEPRRLAELEEMLAENVRRERLAASGLSEAELARILSPPVVAVRFTDANRARAGRAEKVAAGTFQALVLLAIFTSMAYLLTGITGEKQLRVTESITAMISPQAWIDGKILGICAYALATVGNMVVGGVLLAAMARVAWGFALPDTWQGRRCSCCSWCIRSSASCSGTRSLPRLRRPSTTPTPRRGRRSCSCP